MDPHFQMTYNGATNGQSELTAGLGSEQPTKEWWLQSDPQRKGWGPFNTEEAAWRFLFGRDFTPDEVRRHEECGWYVLFENKWPNVAGHLPADI